MVSIQMKTHVGPDGTLHLQVPTSFRETDLEVLVVLHPIPAEEADSATDDLGWPAGFFEETFGCLADDPIERLPQEDYEVREPIQ